ncbi:MAG TPA: PhnD/SsuA/transferrin family substrate-binding protein [Candidatus Bipolaricaulis anaerobius]|uniref:Phosphonate ABC transporter phosphate-binding periplasmic component n=1 Tax=Candidatus Bipolaricaulis anaerobius TaxID=2026885 RepID=A0A2X3KWV7_9BACT|nr:PhnD/SsuA/transferrin family substrate-binding protein [Candidatus Bipolaricaulis anaerobius]MBP7726585.1 PhnD/SsuA/transferrin family substrate-binding protein [Candidatus Bipolaricaulis sp.]SQD92066.1 Putative Phosphonate ABC transporter phosphate-binding periplasmic component [Candidatus Bipolaricaulis anaerobius]HNR24622.1 PhnD/SsuA/transferrin family substrate-binding protein [Candidatus Bipolaricaulis anaerobius]HNS23295.1 PhnD/SsuA/transferrin family substrate-binding protein [Candida
MKRLTLAVLVVTVALGATGLAQALGTRDNPIIWVFPPSTRAEVIEATAKQIVEDIGKATGLYIVPRVMPDYAALVEAFKAAEGNVMGTPTTDQYARISVETNFGAHARLAAVRRGYSFYFSSIYVPRAAGYTSIHDLNGKIWIYNDEGSTSGYVFPKKYLEDNGVVVGGVVKSGGHPNSLIALLKGQGDFCTGYGSPPEPPAGYDGPKWDYGMDPEMWIWDRENNALYPPEVRGTCVDLRYAVSQIEGMGTLEEIIEKIGVLDTVGPLPNDCIAFSAGFPIRVENAIVAAIIAHIRSPEGKALWSNPNFYEWTDVELIDDSYYDTYRSLVGLPNPER